MSDFQAPTEASLIFSLEQALNENIVSHLLRVQIVRVPRFQKPGIRIIIYFGTYTFFLPRTLYFFFSSASASA